MSPCPRPPRRSRTIDSPPASRQVPPAPTASPRKRLGSGDIIKGTAFAEQSRGSHVGRRALAGGSFRRKLIVCPSLKPVPYTLSCSTNPRPPPPKRSAPTRPFCEATTGAAPSSLSCRPIPNSASSRAPWRCSACERWTDGPLGPEAETSKPRGTSLGIHVDHDATLVSKQSVIVAQQ